MTPQLRMAGFILLALMVCLPAPAGITCDPGTTLELIQSQGPDDAREALVRYLAETPDCAALQRDWALLSLRQGRLPEMRQLLQGQLAAGPARPAIHFALGLNLLYDRTAPQAATNARTHLEEARRLLASSTSPASGQGEAMICDGFCLLALSALAGQPEASAQLIGESLQRFEAAGFLPGRGLALKQLAGIRQQQGDHQAALTLATEALDCFRERDTLGGATLAGHLAGNALTRLGRPAEAAEAYQQSLALAEELADDGCGLRNMVALGLLARAGDADRALDWFDRAIPIARRLARQQGMDEMLIYVLTTRATLCVSQMNRYQQALDNFGEALTLARKNDRPITEASCLANMGHIRSVLGDYDAALLELQEAAGLMEEQDLSDSRLASFINREMGYLLWKNGAEEEALRRLERAGTLARECGDSAGLANALHLQGALLSAVDRPAEANTRLEEALALHSRLHDHYGRAAVSYSLGRAAEAMGDPAEAGRRYQESTELGESGDYPILAWSGNYRLGRLALAAGDLNRARDRLERALDTIGEERDRQTEDPFRWSYMEDKHQVYCSYVDLLERQEGAGPCFAVAEQAHASALLHLLGEGERTAIDAEEAQRLLPTQGDLLLEYLLGEDVSFLLVLDSDGLTLHRLPPRHEIETLAAAYLEQLRSPADRVDQPPAPRLLADGRALFALLLDPVAQRLKTEDRRMIIVADGLLHHLPFEALVLPGDGPPRYLARDHQVAYAHSATVLASLFADADADPVPAADRLDLLAIGDPDFDGRLGLPPLPHSGREVRRIASGLARARVFTGDEARKELLTRPELAAARVIHLATHALVDQQPARSSAIVFSLAGVEQQEGLLTTDEIGRLRLDSDLVVLSACSTGLGRSVRGEGVVGLSRAFIAAGSRSVIHTLWPVEDRFTARLMERFFSELGRDQGKAAALTAARRHFIEEGAHPHYWAPFVLVGESSGRLQFQQRQRPTWLLPLLIVLALAVITGGTLVLRRRRH